MVPTADVNTTFALALSVLALMIVFGIKVKGLGGWIHELFCAPFGSNPLLWPFNFLFNLVEYISKPLSHSLRLFGNMYAGEIIFLLLWHVGRERPRRRPFFAVVLGLGWAIFHILIVAAAGLHLHDAHHRVHRDGARASLIISSHHRSTSYPQERKRKWTNFNCWR